MIPVGHSQAVLERSGSDGVYTCGCGEGEGKERIVVGSLPPRLVSQGVLL